MQRKLSTYTMIFIGLMMLPLLSSDMLLPAFPLILKHFHVSHFHVKSTLSWYLLGYGVGQLFYAPLADRFGRKKTLLFGLYIYAVATFISIAVNSIAVLNALRVLQGVGIAACSVIVRVIIVELYHNKASQIFSIVFPFAACSPAIAPPIGGFLIQYSGEWQSIFIVLLIIAVILCVLSYIYLPTSLNIEKSENFTFKSMFINYLRLCQSELFVSNAIVFIAAYAAWFVYIIETPFVFNQMHLSPLGIGLTYVPLTVGFFIGNLLSKKLLKKCSPQQVMIYGAGSFIISSLLFIAMPFIDLSVITIILPMVLLTFSNGFLIANAVSRALLSISQSIAYGSSLIGFLQILFSAIVTFIIAKLPGDHYWVMSFSMIILAICILFGVIFGSKKGI